MSESSNFNSEGTTISSAAISSVGNSFLGNIFRRRKKYRYRVTNIVNDKNGNCIYVEYEDTFQNYGQSSIAKSQPNNKAYTSNFNLQSKPKIGEYIDIFTSAEPYSAASNKSTPVSKTYWNSTGGPLNIWDTFEGDNINLDPTVPGQANDTQMASVNVGNYDKSLMGMIPRNT